MPYLNRVKYLTVFLVALFLIAFEYVRHVLIPQMLHSWPAYFISVATVAGVLLLVNEWVFDQLRKVQTNYLDAVLESSGNSVIIVDRVGEIVQWNRAAELIYGWNKSEVVGVNLPMVPPELMPEAKDMMARIWSGEVIRNYETKRMRKGGEVIPVLLTASPIYDERRNVINVLGISTDLRERKRLEREIVDQQRVLATLQERERLAHELHDGLGQVLGYVNTQSQAIGEMLTKGQLQTARAYLKELTKVSQDAHADVREYILSLKTESSGKPFLVILREYLERFGDTTGICTELISDYAIGEDPFSEQAQTQMLRIIQEAMTNARKHAHAKRVTVSLYMKDNDVEVKIIDDGIGFDVSSLNNDEAKHFGLRIMQDRAADIGGTVSVQSILDKGTSVDVIVPRRKSVNNYASVIG